MIKEKISELFQKCVLFTLLLMLIGLIYSNDNARGLPFQWLQGNNVNTSNFLASFALIFVFVLGIEALRHIKKPSNISSAPSSVGINKSFAYKNTINTQTRPQIVNRPKRLPYESKKKNSSAAGIIIACIIAVIGFSSSILGTLSDMTEPSEQEYGYQTQAEVICADAISQFANGKDLGFSGVNDACDWASFNNEDLYFYTGWAREGDDPSDEVVKYCYVYDEDFNETYAIFKLKGEDAEDNPNAEIVGITVADSSGHILYEVGDCEYAGHELNEYI